MKIHFTIFEIIIGIISVLAGFFLTIIVWEDGYFIGSLMLVVTGFTSILLAVKEIKNPGNSTHWLSVFFTVLRRTFLFLNLMLSTLVIGVLTRLITF